MWLVKEIGLLLFSYPLLTTLTELWAAMDLTTKESSRSLLAAPIWLLSDYSVTKNFEIGQRGIRVCTTDPDTI